MDVDEEMKEKFEHVLQVWEEMDSLVQRLYDKVIDMEDNISGLKRKFDAAFPDEESMISAQKEGIFNNIKTNCNNLAHLAPLNDILC